MLAPNSRRSRMPTVKAPGRRAEQLGPARKKYRTLKIDLPCPQIRILNLVWAFQRSPLASCFRVDSWTDSMIDERVDGNSKFMTHGVGDHVQCKITTVNYRMNLCLEDENLKCLKARERSVCCPDLDGKGRFGQSPPFDRFRPIQVSISAQANE